MFQFKTGRRTTDKVELAQVSLGIGLLISLLAGVAVMSLLSIALHVKLF